MTAAGVLVAYVLTAGSHDPSSDTSFREWPALDADLPTHVAIAPGDDCGETLGAKSAELDWGDAVGQLTAVQNSTAWDEAVFDTFPGRAVGVIANLRGTKALPFFDIPPGSRACLFIVRAVRKNGGGPALMGLVVDTRSGYIRGRFKAHFTPHTPKGGGRACWKEVDGDCRDSTFVARYQKEVALLGAGGDSTAVAIRVWGKPDVGGGPWFTCTSKGCCHL